MVIKMDPSHDKQSANLCHFFDVFDIKGVRKGPHEHSMEPCIAFVKLLARINQAGSGLFQVETSC